MGFLLATGFAFVCGMICAGIKDWRAWLPFAAAAGLMNGGIGRLLGVL